LSKKLGYQSQLLFTHTNYILQWGMLQWTNTTRNSFINKIRILQQTEILQRTWTYTFGLRSTCMRMTCQAFPLWLEHQSSSLLSFVRFSYKFSSFICLFVSFRVNYFFILLYNYSHGRQNRVRKLINLDIKKEIISKRESGKSVGDLSYVHIFQ